MPVYEFRCHNPKCGHISELWSTYEEMRNTVVSCEKCGWAMDNIISRSTFFLDGDPRGWDKPRAKPVVPEG